MPCPLCGDICRCASDANSASAPGWLASDDAVAEPALPGGSPADPPAPGGSVPEDSVAWRQEVAARLNRYQARRKPRPPRYPSLRLRFEDEENSARAAVESGNVPPISAPVSHQALALDRFADHGAQAEEFPASDELPPEAPTPVHTAPLTTAPATAKIIEFPRSWAPTPAPLDELAGPVLDGDRPRILEAPEVVPPPPALGGITIEPARQPDMEKRPGIDIPLRSASLLRRIFSAVIDGVIIAAACALFGLIFWNVTAIRLPRLQIVGFTAALSGVFWAAYEYLLLVYSGSTPGLRLAQLELARFDGRPAGRRLRHWRVFASFLSAASLGMGYAWVFLDEDSLCWHDRITHTYLAPRARGSAQQHDRLTL